MQVIHIRERGIYSFPDGTLVVAQPREPSATLLFYLSDWEVFGGAEVQAERNATAFRIIEANADGQILRFGIPTRWQLDDLSDTGRTAR